MKPVSEKLQHQTVPEKLQHQTEGQPTLKADFKTLMRNSHRQPESLNWLRRVTKSSNHLYKTVYSNATIVLSKKLSKIPLYCTMFYNVLQLTVIISTLPEVYSKFTENVDGSGTSVSLHIKAAISFEAAIGVQPVTDIHCICAYRVNFNFVYIMLTTTQGFKPHS